MNGEPRKPLLVIITRIHCVNGSPLDEYETLWRGGKEYDDYGRFDDSPNGAEFAFLLLHGHHDVAHVGLWEKMKSALQQAGHSEHDYSPIVIFAHSSKDEVAVAKAKAKEEAKEVQWFIFSSEGSSQTSCDKLLEQLKDEPTLNPIINPDKIVSIVGDWMRGFEYKMAKLRTARELLLELWLLLEAAHRMNGDAPVGLNAEDQSKLKLAIESLLRKLQNIIIEPPLELSVVDPRTGQIRRSGIAKQLPTSEGADLFWMFADWKEDESAYDQQLKEDRTFWGNLLNLSTRQYSSVAEMFTDGIRNDVKIEDVRAVLAKCSRSIKCIECALQEEASSASKTNSDPEGQP